ncbi:MAG: starch-binding protein, partial [Clostridia bacterium]|nr:starch-binding protein [Clostridia bacterium]
MKKRILSMILAIVMVAGMIPGFAVTAGAAETIAVYFKNTQNWEKVYVYTWADDAYGLTGGWPGSQMTDRGSGIWSYDVPAEAAMVIFNNGSSQTSDLTIPSDGRNLYDPSTGTWSVYGTTSDYTVTVTADPAVGGTVYGSGTYTENSSVTVSAEAADGYTFGGWYKNGAFAGSVAEYTFTVTEDVSLTALFESVGENPNPGTGSGDKQDLSVFRGTRTDFRDESVYALLISRFYDGDSGNNVHCWDDGMAGNPDSDPAWRGDFKGLIEKLDYIKALGFTAVRLNPVVQNASGYDYHGFHPINLMDIDFRLESDGYTYEDLIDACHARGLKVLQVVNLNNTSTFGEEYLRKLFEVDEEAAWSVTESLIPTETLLAQYPDYAELTPFEQYNARLDMLKAHITETLNADERYHRETNMEYENYLEQQGQVAGDCVDINTENPEVALYLAEICAWYAQMGVDAVLIDD